MFRVEMQVVEERGLYLDAMTQLVRDALRFHSRITLVGDGFSVDCKSVLGVLGIGIQPGDVVAFEADGPDEVAALSSLTRTLQERTPSWVPYTGGRSR